MRPEHVGSRDGGEARVTRRGRGAASLAHRPEELLEHRGGALRVGIRTPMGRRLEDIPTKRRSDVERKPLVRPEATFPCDFTVPLSRTRAIRAY